MGNQPTLPKLNTARSTYDEHMHMHTARMSPSTHAARLARMRKSLGTEAARIRTSTTPDPSCFVRYRTVLTEAFSLGSVVNVDLDELQGLIPSISDKLAQDADAAQVRP